MKAQRKTRPGFRAYRDITADEVVAYLRDGGHVRPARAITQIDLFTALGGDPADLNYMRLAYLREELRQRGVVLGSSRAHLVWMGVGL